jgi:hypothetical protein
VSVDIALPGVEDRSPLNLRILQLGRLLTCVALFGMLDLHWVGLQSVAWVRMINADLVHQQSDGRQVAARDVLEIVMHNVAGSATCDMCHAIAEEKSNEEQDEGEARNQARLDLVPVGRSSFAIHPSPPRRIDVAFSDERGAARPSEPLAPPPRWS